MNDQAPKKTTSPRKAVPRKTAAQKRKEAAEQVATITDLPVQQPVPEESPQQSPLQPGNVIVVESDTYYTMTDQSDEGGLAGIPPLRRKVMAARLRAYADLLDS